MVVVDYRNGLFLCWSLVLLCLFRLVRIQEQIWTRMLTLALLENTVMSYIRILRQSMSLDFTIL